MNIFWNKLKENYKQNKRVEESISRAELRSFDSLIFSFRNKPEEEISERFIKVYNEDKYYAIKYLFYLRDPRGGLGERRTFRICFVTLCYLDENIAIHLLDLIPQYGRWDDLFYLFHKVPPKIDTEILKISEHQFRRDLEICNRYENKINKNSISLIGKWLPSEKTRSIDKIAFKDALIAKLGITHKEYRKALTALHRYLDLVEVKMSAGEWDKIEYPKVPGSANYKYNRAFFKHDFDRRKEYIEDVKGSKEVMDGATKIERKLENNRYNYIDAIWSTQMEKI